MGPTRVRKLSHPQACRARGGEAGTAVRRGLPAAGRLSPPTAFPVGEPAARGPGDKHPDLILAFRSPVGASLWPNPLGSQGSRVPLVEHRAGWRR